MHIYITNKPTIYILTTLVFVWSVTDAFNTDQVEPFLGGQCYVGTDDIILNDTTYVTCVNQCKARTSCKGVSVHGIAKVCCLHMDEGTSEGSKQEACRGYVFSRKRDWYQEEVPGCENECAVGTVCILAEDGNLACVCKECLPVPNIPHGQIYGNGHRRLGTRIAYACDSKFRAVDGDIFRTCMSGGEWSGTSPTCAQYEFYLPSKSGHPNYFLADLLANHISLIKQPYIFFRVRAKNDAHIVLQTNSYQLDDIVEIVLGGWGNSRSIIRRGLNSGAILSVHLEKGIVSMYSYSDFWITNSNSCVQVGKGPVLDQQLILEACGISSTFRYIAIGAGYNSFGEFIFP